MHKNGLRFYKHAQHLTSTFSHQNGPKISKRSDRTLWNEKIWSMLGSYLGKNRRTTQLLPSLPDPFLFFSFSPLESSIFLFQNPSLLSCYLKPFIPTPLPSSPTLPQLLYCPLLNKKKGLTPSTTTMARWSCLCHMSHAACSPMKGVPHSQIKCSAHSQVFIK